MILVVSFAAFCLFVVFGWREPRFKVGDCFCINPVPEFRACKGVMYRVHDVGTHGYRVDYAGPDAWLGSAGVIPFSEMLFHWRVPCP